MTLGYLLRPARDTVHTKEQTKVRGNEAEVGGGEGGALVRTTEAVLDSDFGSLDISVTDLLKGVVITSNLSSFFLSSTLINLPSAAAIVACHP